MGMKKILVLGMAVGISLSLFGCGGEKAEPETESSVAQSANEDSTDNSEEGAIPTAYEAYYLEKIEGEYVDRTDYLELHEDYTGYWIAQDVMEITWDKSNIYDANGNAYSYTIKMDEHNADLYTLILDIDGIEDPVEFMICYELPEEIQNMIN